MYIIVTYFSAHLYAHNYNTLNSTQILSSNTQTSAKVQSYDSGAAFTKKVNR